MPGVKEKTGKLRMDLLPEDALVSIAQVLTWGAGVYGDRNWEKGISYQDLKGAVKRHLAKFDLGQDLDEKDKLPHLAHLAADALMMLALFLRSEQTFHESRIYLYGLHPSVREALAEPKEEVASGE